MHDWFMKMAVLDPGSGNSDCDTGIDTSSTSKLSSVPSLLSTLWAPKPANLARKREVACNSAPRGGKQRKVRASSLSSSEPKSVPPAQWVKQYPGEQLDMSAGKLFCKACQEDLSLRSSNVGNHVKSPKHVHVDGKKRMASKQACEQDIAKALSVHNEQTHLKG